MAGKPYDTLEEVIGLRGTPGHGSLREWGVAYRELPLAPGGGIDWQALSSAVTPSARFDPGCQHCSYPHPASCQTHMHAPLLLQ